MQTTYADQARDLTKDYDAVRAVDHLTFDVNQGETFGFLGPNGAGKTTTIKMLTGQLRPTEGQATVLGHDTIDARDELQARIGVVFEYQNLYERLTGRDNLRFAARLHGVAARRVDQMLEVLSLTQHAEKRVKHYSNGMKQRLLIGRALLHSPDLLFLDEPTRGLDPNVARDIRAFVRDLSKNGVTVFLTTHYMEEADRLSDRVAILQQGQIRAIGTPQQLKKTYGGSDQATLEDVFVSLTGKGLRAQFEE